MTIGLDTGFFVELLRGNADAVEVWKNLVEGEDQGVCSALTLFEIERLGLKGAIRRDALESLLEAIPAVCVLLWIDRREILSKAAGFSHGLGVPAVDALILAAFHLAGVQHIYTTDSHMESCGAKGVSVHNLRP